MQRKLLPAHPGIMGASFRSDCGWVFVYFIKMSLTISNKTQLLLLTVSIEWLHSRGILRSIISTPQGVVYINGSIQGAIPVEGCLRNEHSICLSTSGILNLGVLDKFQRVCQSPEIIALTWGVCASSWQLVHCSP